MEHGEVETPQNDLGKKSNLYATPVVGFRLLAEKDLFSAVQSTQETIKVAEHCTELKVPEPIPQLVGSSWHQKFGKGNRFGETVFQQVL